MQAPKGFRHQLRITTRYPDLASVGVVSSAAYSNYLEQSRVTYYRDLGLWHGLTANIGVIIAQISVDYLLPLTIEDRAVVVWSRVSRLGGKSFEMETLVLRGSDGVLAAKGKTTSVTYDYVQDAAVRVSEEWRQLMIDYEPGLE